MEVVKQERSRFDYVAYDQQSIKLQRDLKEKFIELESMARFSFTKSRWLDKYLDHLEYAYMAAGKEIRDMQIDRDASTKFEEGRGKS